MNTAWRFQFAVWLLALLSAITLVFSEYMYDSTAAVVAFLNTGILLVFATLGFFCQGKKIPLPIRMIIKGVMLLTIFGILWALLAGGSESAIGRAFRIGHFATILMACRFLRIRRSQDYTQIFLLSMLLMVVAAITSGNIVIAPFYILYLILSVYCLLVYQLQRQVDRVRSTRFIGIEASDNELDLIGEEIHAYWQQLGMGRFKITCAGIVLMAMCFALAMFLFFPRLEAGTLLGSSFGARSVSGFAEQIELGSIDKNETLKEVVARVRVRSKGKSVSSSNHPIYLRCVALDKYTRSDEPEGRYYWSRSFLNYFLDHPISRGTITPTAKTLEQEILLNPINSAYLPGIYPIVQVEGLENEKLSASALDHTVTRYYYNSQTPIHYKMASLSHYSPQEAKKQFKKNLLDLGDQWFGLNYNPYSISREIGELAHEITDDLAEKRSYLSQEQELRLDRWRYHLSQISEKNNTPSETSQYGLRSWLSLRQLKEPKNPDIKYQRLCSDLFKASSNLAAMDRQIANDIVDYLRANYIYTLEPPDFSEQFEELAEEDEDAVYDPIEGFLTHDIEGGHCEYFASAMVQLCRSLGIPARLAVGYLAHEYLPERDYYLVRQRDAHSWVEIYTADQDWVLFDPTPLAATASVQQGFLSGIFQQFSTAFEKYQFDWLKYSASPEGQNSLQWANSLTQWVEKLDSTEIAMDEAPSFFQLWFTHHEGESYFYLFLRWMIFFLFLMNLAILGNAITIWAIPRFMLWRKHRKRLSAYSDNSIGFYRDMLCLLQEIHLYKEPHQTSREFALATIAYSQDFAPVGNISEMYYRLRFGKEPLSEKKQERIEEALQSLSLFIQSTKKTTPRPWPWEPQS